MHSRGLAWLEKKFLRYVSSGLIAVSESVAIEAANVTNTGTFIDHFKPRWSRQAFDAMDVRYRSPSVSRFRILYSGRVEADKGIFDLLRAFQWLVEERGADVVLEVCGDGGALPDLRNAIVAAGLSERVVCAGGLPARGVTDALNRCDVVVVPTRSTFGEGLNKVVVEAILARRPVVTSRVCPAFYLAGSAASEAAVDDWLSYGVEIERLMMDQDLYEERVRFAEQIRESFLNHDRSIGQKLWEALETLPLRRHESLGTRRTSDLTESAGISRGREI